MKHWKDCPRCWGTGLVGGFTRPCNEGGQDPGVMLEVLVTNPEWGLGLELDVKRLREEIAKALSMREVYDLVARAICKVLVRRAVVNLLVEECKKTPKT